MKSGKKALTPEFWDRRFGVQARWTKQTREHIFNKIKLKDFQNILDVGCGTGEIALEIAKNFGIKIYGIDKDPEMVETCKSAFIENKLNGEFRVGNGKKLPYPDNHFDMTYCNFLLLWIDTPEVVVREMARVTKPKGYVLALAEPDYGGKIDNPEFGLKELISNSLTKAGADPNIGRMLGVLFKKANLTCELGLESIPWDNEKCRDAFDDEWWFLEKVTENWELVKKKEKKYLEKGLRFSFNPVFYAIGQKVL